MKHRKVRVGKSYTYDPVPMDIFDAKTPLKKGDIVKVVKLPGCPAPNVMGHCHVEKDGQFMGLVLTNSLKPVE
jgi:hypothetical protein